MTQRLTVSLPDEAAQWVATHAQGNTSNYIAQLIEQERIAEMWRRYATETWPRLGITPEWLAEESAANIRSQSEYLREQGLMP